MPQSTWIIAHRGASAEWPENTLEAFEQAFKLHHADMIEFDVVSSKDHIPVVIHDASVNRTTNGKGKVNQLTLEQLQSLDAGYRFQISGQKGYPYRGQGLYVPAFEELLRAFPKKWLFIEIKEANESLIHNVMQLVHQYRADERVIMTSKYDLVFKTMVKDYPTIQRALSHQELKKVYQLFQKGKPYSPPQGKSIASLPQKAYGLVLDDPRWISYLKAAGLSVCFWTINDINIARMLVERGADGIITDLPGTMSRAFLRRI